MDLTLDWSKPLAPPSAGIDFVTDSVAVAPDGTVLVLDPVKSKVSRFASDGKLLGSWGKPGHGKGQFDFLREGETVLISGIAVAPDGTVFVADEGNYRIQAFDPSGKFLRAFGGQGAGGGTFQRVVGVATDGRGFVYATDGDAPRFSVQEYDSKGAFVAEFAAKGAGEDHISRNGAAPAGAATDGTVYVGDNVLSYVLVFGPDGKFESRFGAPGSGAGEFSHPGKIAVDEGGTVFVADPGNLRIEAFTPKGEFLWASTGSASGAGHFDGVGAGGLAAGPPGKLYVIDDSQSLLLAFSIPR